MNLLLWLLLGLAVVVLVGLATLVAGRIRRLHRLHVRTDAARAALESALERRAAQALEVAAVLEAVPALRDRARGLRAAVAGTRAAQAGEGDREAAENVLGRALAGAPRSALPGPVFEELVDAEQLLVLARRVHNDAVRDTRELRSRRLVRWLHLAGTAPMPEYFEIAEYSEIADPAPPAGVTTAAPARPPMRPPA
ncbi:NUDIX hydrolase [Pseudonocardia adelaidensis]|uniref:LemA protein n=1 Tax=Pseudonocardia adelaidensis TaxID=648754 RepID=A0ABP9NNE7_9PSEU